MKRKVNIPLEETKWLLPYYILFDGAMLILIGVIWLITKQLDLSLIWGFLAGNLLSLTNFYTMGLSVQRNLTYDKKKAMLNSNISYVVRYLGLFFILGILLYLKIINVFTSVIPILYPKFAYTIDYIFRKTEE